MSLNQWDAQRYSQHARFVSDLGMPVVDWLAPVSRERILDLGCGDGALTAKLAALGVHVLGLDHSESMVAAARALGLDAVEANMDQFDLGRKFDAVFSNAVLHWTRDIEGAVASVSRHLAVGGRFVGEFGGFGNVAAIVVAMRAAMLLEGLPEPTFSWYYPTPAEFSAVLRRHGFETQRIELIPRPTPLPTGMRAWLETFARPFVSGPSDAVFDRAVSLLTPALRDGEGHWTADYVRLRFHAVLRPGAQA